jgi:hypothetical protein
MKQKTKNKTRLNHVLAVFFITFSCTALSQNCNNYPYQPMSNEIEFNGDGKFKILATSSAAIEFDDQTELMSARREAELLAKRSIAEYINQNFMSQDLINSEINKSKTGLKATDGSTVTLVQQNQIKTQLSSISTKSEAVLKGVMTISSCYTKGQEIRVTVGIKSQSLENATNLSSSMGADQLKSNTTDKTINSENNNGIDKNTKGYDDSKKLSKF